MRPYLQLLRPSQWIKNLAVLAGPALGLPALGASDIPWAVGQVIATIISFCLASSATYAINDTLDRQADALHPVKRLRPVASGAVTPAAAIALAVILIVSALLIAAFVVKSQTVVGLVGSYFVLITLYSLWLKKRIILDVILIAVGFVLRASAGAEAIGVPISPWLVACTFTICMFLGFGKRRCEIAAFEDREAAKEHRSTLMRYTPELLNHLISVSAGIAIMTFLLYTMDRDPLHKPPFDKHLLLYTLPLVCYGVFRYAMQIESGKLTGPTDIFLKDRVFQATILIWAAVAGFIIYERPLKAMFGLD